MWMQISYKWFSFKLYTIQHPLINSQSPIMIVTGIFLFLLGTKLGEAASKTEVKYEGSNKISVKEERDDNIIIPGLGSPPFAPGIIHQGSNFFFNPQIVLPQGLIPTQVEEIIPFNSKNITITETKSEITQNMELIVSDLPAIVIPEVENKETNQLPPVPVDIEIPRPDPILILEEPSISCVEINDVPPVPVFIEEPIQLPEVFISEVKEIPPPPELPPLVLPEIPRPVFQEERNVIFIPSAPELATFYPPSIVANSPLIPDCVQNIVMERFLHNVAFENGKMVEIIPIPGTKRAPIETSIIY